MIKLGDIVPLSVQISDGNPKLEVVVKVMSPAGNLLFEGPLSHALDGFYETKQFVMPELDFVFALYSVTNSKEYSNSSEIFYRFEVEEISRAVLDGEATKYDNYYQGIVIQNDKDDFLEGYISGTVEA